MGPARTLQLSDVEVGKEYDGVVVSIRDFGAFVNIGCQNDGLLHISQVRARACGERRLAGRLAEGLCCRAAASGAVQPCAACSRLQQRPPRPARSRRLLFAPGSNSRAPHAPTLSTPRPPITNPPRRQISTDFVRNVSEAVAIGQAVRVRVLNVDSSTGKFAVTTISESDKAAAAAAAAAPTRYEPEQFGDERRQQRRPAGGRRGGSRPTPNCEEGDVITGKVVSAAPFGAFVEVRARAAGPATLAACAAGWLAACLPARLAGCPPVLHRGAWPHRCCHAFTAAAAPPRPRRSARASPGCCTRAR